MNMRLVLSVLCVALFLLVLSQGAQAATINVGPGQTYTTIQAGINAANAGDTVNVLSGTYNEHVVVNKSISLIGNGFPVVDGLGGTDTITITASSVTLQGFSMINASAGIHVSYSNNNNISGNVANNTAKGIFVDFSNNNNLTGNVASTANNSFGIYLYCSDNNLVLGNTLNNNQIGIFIWSSNNNVVSGNIAYDCSDGIYLSGQGNNVSGNSLSNNSADGIDCYGIGNNVTSNTVNGNNEGICLFSTSNYNVSGNTVNNNHYDGILATGLNNSVSGNTVNNNGRDGISIYNQNNTVSGNTANNNGRYGIILNNFVYGTSNNLLKNNDMSGNLYDFGDSSSYNNTVDSTNLVGGKPIYHLVGVSDVVIDQSSGAGTVYLINCSNITVKDLTLTDNVYGVYLMNTDNSLIENINASIDINGIYLYNSSNNNVSGNIADNDQYGILLDYSSNYNKISDNSLNSNTFGFGLSHSSNNTTIMDNTAIGNGDGIYLGLSSDNNATNNTVITNGAGFRVDMSNNTNVSDNIVSGNSNGIYFDTSDNNSLWNNTIQNNDEGLILYGSNGNNVTRNGITGNTNAGISFFDSANNVVWLNVVTGNGQNLPDYTGGFFNYWNSSTPLEYDIGASSFLNYTGNYWGDYVGPDANDDGIGDTPYTIDEASDNFDLYPMDLPGMVTPSFTYYTPSVSDPLTIQFNDTSAGYRSSWSWDFGDGSDLGTVKDPVHTYTAPGAYTVKLTVENNSIEYDYTQDITVPTTSPIQLQASFTTDRITGAAPIYVWFSSTSTGDITSQDWEFNDGTGGTPDNNPGHNFQNPGTYTVTLTVYDAEGDSSTNNTIIYVSPPDTSANFGFAPGADPLSVQFDDRSTGTVTGWDWDFGDNSAHSGDQSPYYIYASPGTYSVTLITTYDEGSSLVNYDVTVSPPALQPSFTPGVAMGPAPLTVSFTDMTTGGTVTDEQWDFGDGSDNGSGSYVEHTYDDLGTYTVILTVSDGTNYYSNTGTVVVMPPSGLVHNIDTGETFTSIQDAIDDADTVDGNTLLVDSGAYRQNVDVNKRLIIKGNDTGSGLPIVYETEGNIITLSAPGTIIDGITSMGANYGFYATGNDILITNCSATASAYGFYVENLDNITLRNCTSYGNGPSDFDLQYITNSLIDGCTAWDSGFDGIDLDHSSNVTINGTVSSAETQDAMAVHNSHGNFITNSTFKDESGLGYSGIYFEGSSDNIVTHNTFTNDTFTVYLWAGSTNNTLYLNDFDFGPVDAVGGNFFDSGVPLDYVYDNGENSSILGNHWGDYDGSDDNGDGIGDSPYSVDNYPLIDTQASYLISGNTVTDPVKDLNTGLTYTTISDAIEDINTLAGDTIIVGSGTYEDVDVSKSLKIMGIDTGDGQPVINSNSDAGGAMIEADNVTFDGFNIETRYSGIDVESSYCTISHNNVSSDSKGIYLGESSSYNNITDNNVSFSDDGIYLERANYNNLTSNVADYDTNNGLYLSDSSYNNLTGNTADNNANIGIYMSYSHDNVLWLNNFANNDVNAVSNGDGPYTATNIWNSTSPLTYTDYNGITQVNYTGNYWGDYSGPDANSDGIGDTYYPIADFPDFNYDQYPMILEAPPAHINPIIVDSEYGTGMFTNIHDALGYARPGDTIIVDSGTYNENLAVTVSVNITGQDTGDGKPVVNGLFLMADGVTLQGLSISNVERGMYVASSNNTIKNNLVYNDGAGIYFYANEELGYTPENNTLINNTFLDDTVGIYIDDSDYNNIVNNTFSDSYYAGVALESSIHNNIVNNTFNNNGDGIDIEDSSDNNNVTGNLISDSNNDGIYLYYSSGNVFWLNTFNNNDENVETYGDGPETDTNIWNSATPLMYADYNGISHENYTGNYWDDYTGFDVNGDGIGDTPYVVDENNVDLYPMLLSGPAPHINPIVVDPVPGVGMFTDISDAIDYALPGDIIIVDSGVYSAISVYKPLNITGVDTGAGMPEIGGTDSIYIEADDATFSGFNVSGISVQGITVGGHNDTISNNIVSGHHDDGEDTGTGIFIESSGGNNTVTGNILRNNSLGIMLWFSYNNTLWLNTLNLNDENARAVNDGLPAHTNYWNSTMPLAYEDYNDLQHVGYVGNCWGDYTGQDVNSDGIGDTPYMVDDYNIDNYPLLRYTTIIVDQRGPGYGNFTDINSALDNASSGDTIVVDSGTYNECLKIEKTINIVGRDTGTGMPVVNAGVDNKAFTFDADGITMQGLNISGSDSGILVRSSNNTIQDNSIGGNGDGIDVYQSEYPGIPPSNNTVINNTFRDNAYIGVLIMMSNNNRVLSNAFDNNSYHGIYLNNYCSYNDVSGNVINGSGQNGIYLSSSENNNISSNTVNDSSNDGICLDYSSNNNTLTGNLIENCTNYGIYLSDSSGNTLWLNTFINNSVNAMADGSSPGAETNVWNSATPLTYTDPNGISHENYTGNYWDDYTGLDVNGDGIGDSPYAVDDYNVDNYPMLLSAPPGHINPIVVDPDYENDPTLGHFNDIAPAIDYALPGDTIFVHSGSYNAVTVDKSVNILGVDTGDGLPLLPAQYDTYTVSIYADNVTFSGFNVTGNSYRGISIESNNTTISNNIITGHQYGDGYGIYIDSTGNNNTLVNNNASYNNIGIFLDSSGVNNLTDNIVKNSTNIGVRVVNSNNNNLTGNIADNNTIYGISLETSNYNNLTDNSANNTFLNDDFAGDGFYLDSSTNNNLTRNLAGNNLGYGVELFNSTNNTFWLNTFTGNNVNAYTDHEDNVWNSSSPVSYVDYNGVSHENYTGNYWGDYTGLDVNVDGIGDTPYAFDQNSDDNYPMLLSGLAAHINPIIVDPVQGVGMFSSIQDAVDYAWPGDTILVDSGTYTENVVVDKPVILTGKDTGNGPPVIDGTGGTGIAITANGTTVQGFNTTNAQFGIEISSSNNIVSGNVANNNYDYGIFLDSGSNNNIVSGNTADNNEAVDIYVYYGSINNTVTGNTANNSSNEGIYLWGSDNTVTGNTVNNNYYGFLVISNNIVSGNTANDNTEGIELDGSNNTLVGNIVGNNVQGIYLWGSNNTVTGNTANNNTNYGIFLDSDSNNNTISGNTANNNSYDGIELFGSNNTLVGNIVSNNRYGFDISGSNNALWLNVISGNTVENAFASNGRPNQWNSTTPLTYTDYNGISHENYTGNYWGDYNGLDVNGDGIGDSPYTIDDYNIDNYPMLLSVPVGHVNPIVVDPVQGVGMFTTIQDAVDYAWPGNTILVDSGTYAENVGVNKNLTIIGNAVDGSLPVVDASLNSYTAPITVSTSGVTLDGLETTGFFSAGILVEANDCTLRHIYSHDDLGAGRGIMLAGANNTTISDYTAANEYSGIGMDTSWGVTIHDAFIQNMRGYGIEGNYVNHTYIDNINITDTDYGIGLNTVGIGNTSFLNNITVINTTEDAVELGNFDDVSIIGLHTQNISTGSYMSDLDIQSCNNVTIRDYSGVGGFSGIWAPGCYNVSISDCTIFDHASGEPISTMYGKDWYVRNVTIDDCSNGIEMQTADNITISDVTINNTSWHGFYASCFNNSTITGLHTTNTTHNGIKLLSSDNSTVMDSQFLYSGGPNVTNTACINVTNSSNITIKDSLAGESPYVPGVYLLNTLDSDITNVTVTHSLTGINLYSSNDDHVTDNTVLNNDNEGVYLLDSYHNDLSGNNVSYDNNGIYLDSSDDNNLADNIASNDTNDGLHFYSASNNNASANTLCNNSNGIHFESASNNVFWLNVITDDLVNVTVNGDPVFNTWNSTSALTYKDYNGISHENYTGNYWGDYNGRDANSDGIGDSPYVIDEYNVDLYPMLLEAPAENVPLIADFTASVTSGDSPLTVQFNDTSMGSTLPDTWNWAINNEQGTTIATYSSQNFTYEFLVPGDYNVTLTASNTVSGETNTSDIHTIYVTSSYNASFTDSSVSGLSPLTVQFNDTSVDNNMPNAWNWTINNGLGTTIATNNNQNFTYTFLIPGNYSVTLTAFNTTTTESASTASQNITLGSNFAASFTATPSSGLSPLIVQLNDTSTGNNAPDTWDWTVNNGHGSTIATNNSQNFSYTFNDPDNYTVSLTASNSSTMESATASSYVNVSAPDSLTAGFIANATIGAATLSVQFNDTTTGYPAADSWNYTISNSTATVYVNSQNFTYQFEYPDTYLVSLNASNSSNSVFAISGTQQITVYPAMAADFTMDRSSGHVPLTVQFNDTTTGYPAADSWNWSITNSTDTFYITSQNFSYTFLYPDTYAVSLNASDTSSGTWSVSQIQYVSAYPALAANFTADIEQGVSPLTVQFTDTSMGTMTGWEWNFSDGTGNFTTRNVTHVFNNPGPLNMTYTVTLTVNSPNESSTKQVQAYVFVAPQPPTAYFYTDVQAGIVPLTVHFTNMSGGSISSWYWDFGDGNNSTLANPVHTYMTHGTYTVSLNVTNDGGSNTCTYGEYISANDPTPISTDYSLDGTMGTDGWYSDDVTVTLTPVGGSGEINTVYSFDNVTWQDYYDPITVSDDGVTHLFYYSYDTDGNVEPVDLAYVKIEKTGLINVQNVSKYLTGYAAADITYTLTDATAHRVYLCVYDADGNLISTVDQGLRSSGDYDAYWYGTDDNGYTVNDGNYTLSIYVSTNGDSSLPVTMVKQWTLFKDIRGLAVDTSGNVFVADSGHYDVKAIYANKTINQLGSGSYYPESIAADPSGNVYVADWWTQSIKRISPAGAVTSIAGINYPYGVTADSSGKRLCY